MSASDPYRGSSGPGRTAQVLQGLQREFLALCDEHPRGVFARISDEGVQAVLLLAAVARVVAPLITEVERLRREVEVLKGAPSGTVEDGRA